MNKIVNLFSTRIFIETTRRTIITSYFMTARWSQMASELLALPVGGSMADRIPKSDGGSVPRGAESVHAGVDAGARRAPRGGVWRYPWSVCRPENNIRSLGSTRAWEQLSVPGRLRGQGQAEPGDSVPAVLLQVDVPIVRGAAAREPRGQGDQQRVRIQAGGEDKVWDREAVEDLCDTFASMSVCALVGRRVLCMHGGLSPALLHPPPISPETGLGLIEELDKPCEIPDKGLLCDLLWSDPCPHTHGWAFNHDRGVSYVFGTDVVTRLCEEYDLDLIVRAHMWWSQTICYEFFCGKIGNGLSAVHYTGQFNNLGACLRINENMQCGFTILHPPQTAAAPAMPQKDGETE